MNVARFAAVGLLIVGPALMRVVTVEWNVVPIGALALFCGTRFRNRALAMAIPIGAMLLGDLLLGIVKQDLPLYLFHADLPFVYGAYAISVAMGFGLRGYWDRAEGRAGAGTASLRAERSQARAALPTYVVPVAAATLAGSIIFFVVSNFGMWLLFNTYAKTWRGLIDCYLAAVPFFRGTVTGDVLGSAFLFAGDYLLRLNAAPLPESERI